MDTKTLSVYRRFENELRALVGAGPPTGVIACSGGVDSMVLLDLFRRYGERHGFACPSVCHVNHRQRASAQDDERFVRRHCEEGGLDFRPGRPRLPSGASEQEMRKARYASLARAAGAGGSVFTAHHADDELETYLFRLIRGAHPATLKGIAAKSSFGRLTVIRPLLPFTKAEIVGYARTTGLDWREDPTNADPRYARNRVRNELVPLLESLRPGADNRVLSFFHAVSEKQEAGPPSLAARALRRGVPVLKCDFQALKRTIDNLLGNASSRTTQAHWNGVKRQLAARQAIASGGGPVKTIQFPGGQALRFEGNRLFWVSATRAV